jgi:hypothetical protein
LTEINSKLFRDDPAAYYAAIGASSERKRIIDLALSSYDFFKEVSDAEFKLPDGNDVIEVNEVHMIFNRFRAWAHEQITGEK